MKFPDSIIAGLNVEMIKYDKGLNIIHFQKKQSRTVSPNLPCQIG